MFFCYDCGEFFDEPITLYDGHSELDEGPIWEAYGACPYCQSDQIDIAQKCDICGDYVRDGICENCEDFIKDKADDVRELISKYKLDKDEFINYLIEELEK